MKQLFAVAILLFIHVAAHAQRGMADSLPAYNISNNVQLYMDSTGSNLQLYNGAEYVFLYQKVNGFSFYAMNTLQDNTIVYNGTLYQHVPLAYDIVNNQVVTQTPDKNYIQLVAQKINSFTINNHLFVAVTAADAENTILTPGFYDATITHAATVLIKHEKIVMHSSRPEEPDHFNEYNYYYIKTDSSYYAVKSSKTLLYILQDKSNEVRAFLHQKKLNFKRNPEQAIVKAVEYYAQLKK